MSEHPSGPVETGAKMDYAEHERTYSQFLNASKYGTVLIVALLIGMAVGFFTGGGFLGGFFVFLVLSIAGVVMTSG